MHRQLHDSTIQPPFYDSTNPRFHHSKLTDNSTIQPYHHAFDSYRQFNDSTTRTPTFNDSIRLETATQRLVAEFQPEEIYLFGSHAWGTPDQDSDIDLMVIVPQSEERPIRRDQRAQRCLGRLPVSADVLVRTRHEVNRVRELQGSLTHEVMQKGRKIYG